MKKQKVFISVIVAFITLFPLIVFTGCQKKGGEETPVTIVYDFSVKSTDFVVELGTTYKLSAEYGNERVSYEVDDDTVLSINENGLITPVKKGVAYITVTATNTNKTVICKVTVADGVSYKVVFDDIGYDYELSVNASKRFSVKTFVENVEYKDEITWVVENNPQNVTLTKIGNDCTFKASVAGTYVLKALSSKGGVATINVIVR